MPNSALEKYVVIAAVVERGGTFLITRRQNGTHLEGYWEFPGGKCEPGETHAKCLKRELREELDVEIVIGKKLLSLKYTYSDRIVQLHFYQCKLRGTPHPQLGQSMLWVPRKKLATFRFLPADEELLVKLIKKISK